MMIQRTFGSPSITFCRELNKKEVSRVFDNHVEMPNMEHIFGTATDNPGYVFDFDIEIEGVYSKLFYLMSFSSGKSKYSLAEQQARATSVAAKAVIEVLKEELVEMKSFRERENSRKEIPGIVYPMYREFYGRSAKQAIKAEISRMKVLAKQTDAEIERLKQLSQQTNKE